MIRIQLKMLEEPLEQLSGISFVTSDAPCEIDTEARRVYAPYLPPLDGEVSRANYDTVFFVHIPSGQVINYDLAVLVETETTYVLAPQTALDQVILEKEYFLLMRAIRYGSEVLKVNNLVTMDPDSRPAVDPEPAPA